MGRALAILLMSVAAVVALPRSGRAQGGEVFGGYSYLRSNTGPGFNANGWEGSLTGNFNRFFGLEVNLTDHYNSLPAGYGFSNNFCFLFGPHFTFRAAPKVAPFAHVLVGGTRGSATFACPLAGSNACPVGVSCSCPATQDTAFTTALGGGLDVKAARVVWIRVFQADYLREQFTSYPQNDVRLSFGIVLRFSR